MIEAMHPSLCNGRGFKNGSNGTKSPKYCGGQMSFPTGSAWRRSATISPTSRSIGAGADCDGQVLVCNDLLGFDGSFQPRFVKRYAELEQPMVDAVRSYCDEVRDGSFPTPAHAFHRRRGPKKVAKLY